MKYPTEPMSHNMPNDGVVMRAIEPEDLDFLYSLENDIEMWMVGETNVPYSRFALNNYVMTSSSDIYADRQLLLLIQKTDGKPIGLLDIFNFEPRHLRAEIGVAVVREERDRGYGHAALLKAIDYCHRIIHLHQVYALVDESNKQSVNLFLGAGFKTTCVIKDWVYDGEHYHDALMMNVFFEKNT